MTTERTALKEWAVLIEAMARGDIIAMVRKGGIREQRAGFSVRHDRFLLYPTFFHERVDELAPRFRAHLADAHASQPRAGLIRLAYLAEVAGVWSVGNLQVLRDIEAEHGLAWSAVASRFHYRGKPGVQVIAVRVARLPFPIEIPEARRYQGCVSWVELDADIDVSGAIAILDPASLTTRLTRLGESLGAAGAQHAG